MVEVVAGDDDEGVMLLAILLQQLLDDELRTGVEEVEGLVQDEQARVVDHSGDDAYLLLVAHGVVADELFLANDFVVHEALEGLEAFVHGLFAEAVHLADEVEVFFGGEVVDEEAVVDVGAGELFPGFALANVDAIEGDVAVVGLQEVEDEAEEGGFTGSVVSYQAEHFALGNVVVVDVYGGFLAEVLLEVVYLNHISLVFRFCGRNDCVPTRFASRGHGTPCPYRFN